MIDKGSFVISLDFEMMWGCKDWTSPEVYGMSNIAQVSIVIDRLLRLFKKYNVRATIATVGMIMLEDKEDALNSIPQKIPSYMNKRYSPYSDHYIEKIEDNFSYMYFAPKLIEKLAQASQIEIGTHTYCHYYCWEKGQTKDEFEEDLKKAIEVANRKNITLKSIVFPKNQVSNDYLNVCAENGIKTYRGNPKKYFAETKNPFFAVYYRIARLLDTYINWGGNTSVAYSAINKDTLPINVPASRMLRPYMHALRFLEPLRLRRIKNEMLHAAKHHELYHLWWHPHNFGANMEQNFLFLEEVLKCYKKCHEDYGMQAMTMSDFYYSINN